MNTKCLCLSALIASAVVAAILVIAVAVHHSSGQTGSEDGTAEPELAVTVVAPNEEIFREYT